MLRYDLGSFAVAFSESADGDLRVSNRNAAEPLAEVQARTVAALGVPAVAVARQVHGAGVMVVCESPSGYCVGASEGDAVVTRHRHVAVAVHVGDCLPIAVGGAGGVAMIHGGWRGLAGGVIDAALAQLRDAGELRALIGPGAGGCCYETGDEVRARFEGLGAASGRMLDLKAVAAAKLRAGGVVAVEDVGLCTICQPPERFFSHRRDGAAAGRQGGFAWLL
ncbi:MAG TPA: polyphenol oxidase family protein [Solirubrobacteraceae bacterium]